MLPYWFSAMTMKSVGKVSTPCMLWCVLTCCACCPCLGLWHEVHGQGGRAAPAAAKPLLLLLLGT